MRHTITKLLGINLLALLSGLTYANPVHTWHTISSKRGEWNARLQMINQGGGFVTPQGESINAFQISPGHTQDYGFSFDRGDDFDVAYTLTLTEKNNGYAFFQSKACVYVITARGPANPDIRVSEFNGAQCHYTIVSGRGEDFEVS